MPALSAQIVGQSIASEIERRSPFRRVMKQAIEKSWPLVLRG